jgi:hypothetical protein
MEDGEAAGEARRWGSAAEDARFGLEKLDLGYHALACGAAGSAG